MTTTIEVTKFVTEAGIKAELGRRRNNKGRDAKARSANYVYGKLSKADAKALLAGEVVTLEFGSGRVEHVGVK